MAEKFLAKFFPPAKIAQLKSEIGQFKQNDFESLYEAWERYKDLIRALPSTWIAGLVANLDVL